MSNQAERDANEAAYRRLKDEINDRYPVGQYIGIADGRVVANASTFHELDAMLESMGKTPRQTLVVQAGVEYPEYAVILQGM